MRHNRGKFLQVGVGLSQLVLQVTPATAQAEATPAQRFDVGFRLVDGQPVRLTLVASGTAKGRGTVTEDYVPAPDGTWHVHTRSEPIQSYFESGYPHGEDQFISITAAGWATTALALALPEK